MCGYSELSERFHNRFYVSVIKERAYIIFGGNLLKMDNFLKYSRAILRKQKKKQ